MVGLSLWLPSAPLKGGSLNEQQVRLDEGKLGVEAGFVEARAWASSPARAAKQGRETAPLSRVLKCPRLAGWARCGNRGILMGKPP
jgi:hypothetical protein